MIDAIIVLLVCAAGFALMMRAWKHESDARDKAMESLEANLTAAVQLNETRATELAEANRLMANYRGQIQQYSGSMRDLGARLARFNELGAPEDIARMRGQLHEAQEKAATLEQENSNLKARLAHASDQIQRQSADIMQANLRLAAINRGITGKVAKR